MSYKPEGLFSSGLALPYFPCLGNCYFTLFASTDTDTDTSRVMLLMADGFPLDQSVGLQGTNIYWYIALPSCLNKENNCIFPCSFHS